MREPQAGEIWKSKKTGELFKIYIVSTDFRNGAVTVKFYYWDDADIIDVQKMLSNPLLGYTLPIKDFVELCCFYYSMPLAVLDKSLEKMRNRIL